MISHIPMGEPEEEGSHVLLRLWRREPFWLLLDSGIKQSRAEFLALPAIVGKPV